MMKVFMRHCVLWLVWDRVIVLFPEKRFGVLCFCKGGFVYFLSKTIQRILWCYVCKRDRQLMVNIQLILLGFTL